MKDPYPPIGDYALIGDCHSVALVSRTGSVDWACPRRFDAGSCFARILDWQGGGHCSITPTDLSEPPLRSYVDGTLVLETTFRSADGECRVYDCFTMRRGGADHPRRELLRVVEGVRSVSVEEREQAQVLVVQVDGEREVTHALLGRLDGSNVGRVSSREPTLEDAYVALVTEE